MGVYRLSIKADLDIAELYEHGIATFGLLQAQKYVTGMHHHFQTLSNNAELGRDASEFAPSLLRFVYKAHTIFYRITDDGVFIVRILGQSMDYPRHI
ncbi:type II toxin-antitoxin system RelE/ParE family toxin [Marixanthomonas spongiae]|uniref:Toxin n=1 Tax=Marixanthomonas spongiae TaxID=2174845 RepID=A0A2U0I7V5_9FLAO|nr:type II toxin-antitoxin system RelE/ParE family toxin [Marixanthomonas spongiae]PVW17183.1 type II toxin-antitoxin system RelE/ParE family toxin [Marixanthomonas spongiae]